MGFYSSSVKSWEHFNHDADMGVRGWGKTCEEAFEMAATALTGIITNPSRVEKKQEIKIACRGKDLEFLLVAWLNDLIYEIDTRKMLFGNFKVHIQNFHLEATLSGEPVNIQKHEPVVDVKGASFTELLVQEQNGLWVAQCVIDV